MRGRMLIAVCVGLASASASAATLPTTHQYIARKRAFLFTQPNASAPAPIKDFVATLGGHLDLELPNWFVVSIPDAALQAIKGHPMIKYLQRVIAGPVPAPASTTVTSGRHLAADGAVHSENGPPQWTSGTYVYDGAGNISAIGADTYQYDAVSRLIDAHVKSNHETYSYDAFGNLISKTTTPAGGSSLTVDLTTSLNTNRLVSQSYDAAGNLTGDTSEKNTFDPVNLQREKDITSGISEVYIYDANDERLGVIQCAGAGNCNAAPMFWSLRDEQGKVLRQFEASYFPTDYQNLFGPYKEWSWEEDYVYRDNLLLGAERVAEEGGRRHFHLDHLGTARLVTGSSGEQLSQQDYYPFGVQIPPSFTDTTNGWDREEPMRFTGHERDFNVGTASENANYNDYMHARNTVPQWGHFLSVDPELHVDKALHQPQAWNRYAYVENNPIRYADPTGRELNIPTTLAPQTTPDMPSEVAIRQAVYLVGTVLGGEAVGMIFEAPAIVRAATAGAVAEPIVEGPTFYGTPNGEIVAAKTPAGQEITPHAAWRMGDPPAGRAQMTPTEADRVLAKNIIRKVDTKEATVTYHDPSAPGKPQVSVSVTNNGRITTVIKNVPKPPKVPEQQ